jgi:hypothetical protein
MLFPRRPWALLVTERMGLAGSSNETTLLVDLLIWSAKQDERMLAGSELQKLSKAEGILMGALTMVNNASAVGKVARELGVDQAASVFLLRNMQTAGLSLAEEYDYSTLVEIAKRRGLS